MLLEESVSGMCDTEGTGFTDNVAYLGIDMEKSLPEGWPTKKRMEEERSVCESKSHHRENGAVTPRTLKKTRGEWILVSGDLVFASTRRARLQAQKKTQF